jgi:serine phosphatase RsbU (regulator of sigma subunit)
MSLSAEIQWALLPPMTMTTPQVALAGILEPAYDVAGDSFDYAINGNVLHLAVIDAMGHGLNAAMLATLGIGAYRHARRAGVGLAGLYGLMDAVIEQQFGAEQFVTAQLMRLDIATGQLQWVNGTLPVGFGGATPVISEHQLRRGDRVLFFTDGAFEEHRPGGRQFGMERLIDFVERAGQVGEGVQEMVRGLSRALASARGGVTTDDTTLFLVEWRGGSAGQLAAVDV